MNSALVDVLSSSYSKSPPATDKQHEVFFGNTNVSNFDPTTTLTTASTAICTTTTTSPTTGVGCSTATAVAAAAIAATTANNASTPATKSTANATTTTTVTTAPTSSLLSLKSERRHCLYLSDDPIRFEPVSEVTSVFFDESNQQLIISRSNGTGGVVVKSRKDRAILSLRLEDKGEIRSLNFSNHSKILAIQRTNSRTVDFVNMYPGCEVKEFRQLCKLKNSRILGTCWCHDDEIIIVTDRGIEHYQVFPDKLSLKLLKNVSMETHWHYWTSSKNLCILSTGTYANIFYSFIFKDSTLTKLPKFEVPLHTSPPQMLKQKDIVLITVYGQVYVSHIFNDRGASQSLSVYLYKVKREGIMKATEVLTLSLTLGGKLVLHVVDNLIVLHHQWSKTSYIFDIGLVSSHVVRGGVKYFQPIACHPIRPFTLKDRRSTSAASNELQCELYSPHWAIFGPDVVLDAKLGCYWNLHLDVENLVSFFDDDVDSIEMLLLRSDSKSLILKLCQEIIESQSESSMVDLKFMSIIFLKFNSILTSKDKDDDEVPKRQLITQKDVFYNLLKPLNDNGKVCDKVLDWLLVEYVSSLSHHHIRVEHEMNDMLLTRLIRSKNYSTLQQLLQYHVIPHCKPVALLLLSVEDEFPAGCQIAYDILKRQSATRECLLEVLLNKKMVLPALRYAQTYDMIDNLSVRKWFDITMATNDKLLFYHVFNFFANRNLRLRGSTKFIASDKCDKHVEYYNKLYSEDSAS